MEGGTEAFPDLGMHCQLSDCKQLDFLPFRCAGCRKVFCVEHRTHKSHDCPKSNHNSRKVVVCETCSLSIETTGCNEEDEKAILQRHEMSGGCDPKNKKKPTCAVRLCKEILTFSNTSTCKTCHIKVCLKHRFPTDHACKQNPSPSSAGLVSRESVNKFLNAFASRNGKDCAKKTRSSASSASSTPSIKAY